MHYVTGSPSNLPVTILNHILLNLNFFVSKFLESPVRGEDIDFKFKFKKERQIVLTFLPEGFMPKSSGKTRIFTEKKKRKIKMCITSKRTALDRISCSSFVSFTASEIKVVFARRKYITLISIKRPPWGYRQVAA